MIDTQKHEISHKLLLFSIAFQKHTGKAPTPEYVVSNYKEISTSINVTTGDFIMYLKEVQNELKKKQKIQAA